MGSETPGIAFQQVAKANQRRRNARITVKGRKNVALEAPAFTVLDKDCCLLNPFDYGAASPCNAIAATPLLSDAVGIGAVCLPKINYRGWSPPGLGWEAWVREMACDPKTVSTWKRAGIDGAIMGSIVNIKPDRALMEALFGFWNPATHTFVFPWGEASFTLEDAHVLGNLSVSGSRLDRELTDEEEELRIRLYVEKEKILELHPNAKAARRVNLDVWLQWFLELQGEEELKHLGFLAYWLAKCVVPSYPYGEVPKVIFGLAARLYHGDQIALGPVVTANIYYDLSGIYTFVLGKPRKRRGNKIDVWAQFGLLQAWVWARFESLCPVPHGAGTLVSESHISRLGCRRTVTGYDEALAIFQDEKSYSWRPYSRSCSGWKEPTWYDGVARIIHVEVGMPSWVYDYVAIISPSMLQGFYGDTLISSEKYQPHRVARQFGYDQAIPISNDSLTPWISNSNRLGQYVQIPEITRRGSPTKDYLPWWQKQKIEYQKALDEFAMHSPGLASIHKTGIKPTDKGPGGGFSVSRTSFESSYQHCNHQEQEKEEDSRNVLAEPGGNHAENLEEKNEEVVELTNSHEVNSVVEVDEYDGNRSKVSCNDIHQFGNRKRKLEIEEISRKAEISSVPFVDVVVIDDDSDEDDTSEEEGRRLVEELENFQCRGLLNEWDPSFSELEDEDSSNKCCSDTVMTIADPYGQEAIRLYPQFFELIPQKPHYRGLLDGTVSEEVRYDVYLSKWYKLVDLMAKTLQTTCQTDPSEFEELMMEAQKFEGYGFNVKHILARLKEPQARIRRLTEARIKLEEAKGREHHATEMDTLKRHIYDLGSKLKVIEKKLEETQEALVSSKKGLAVDRMNVRREVETAETHLRAMEHEVEAMNVKLKT